MQATDQASEELVVALFSVLRTLKRMAADEHVDKGSLMVLHTLACAEPIRLSDAASAIGLDLSTVSRHVRTLEDGGFVRRTDDPKDRRASLLALTDEGQQVLQRAYEARRAAFGAATSSWSEADRATLAGLLTRLAQDLTPRTSTTEIS